jgi:hypothetical protein
MARCYELSAEQSRLWTEGDAWASWRLEEDVLDWADANNVREPIIVVTETKQIAFAITEKGVRA